MIETLTDSLPPEQKARLHADFLANEQDYLRLRESLLGTHRGLWVAVHEGKVIAEGANFMTVMASLADCGFHPFIAQVGAEDEEAFRIRRQEFPYDQAYRPNPMPRIEIVFWNQSETLSRHFFDAIPDTGADITVLPEDDCKALGLASSLYSTTKTRGYMGSSVRTVFT